MGAAPFSHPHTPDWFRELYKLRELTPEEFYGEFWKRLQSAGYKHLVSIRGVAHDASEFTSNGDGRPISAIDAASREAARPANSTDQPDEPGVTTRS